MGECCCHLVSVMKSVINLCHSTKKITPMSVASTFSVSTLFCYCEFLAEESSRYYFYVSSGVVMFFIRNVWQGLLELRETGFVFFVIKLGFRVFPRGKAKHGLEN